MQHAGMHFSDHHYICRLQKMKERILKSGNTSHSSNQYTRRPDWTAMVQLTKRKTENSTASDGQQEHVWWIDYLKEKKSTVNPPLHNISITALQVKEYSILRPYVLSSSWSAVQTTGTETKETYSIMIILLSLSLAPATKKNLCLWRPCRISTNLLKGTSDKLYMKAAALLLFPKKDGQDIRCTFTDDRLAFRRVLLLH